MARERTIADAVHDDVCDWIDLAEETLTPGVDDLGDRWTDEEIAAATAAPGERLALVRCNVLYLAAYHEDVVAGTVY